jgi:F0F1-type ATP synthase delta subunit
MVIIPLIILLALVFAVMVVVFQKIMKENVVLATRHLEELSQDYVKKEKEIDMQLEETKQKCDQMLTQAQEEAVKEKEKIVKEADSEKTKILEHARQQAQDMIEQADKSRKLLLAEINERINKEANQKACELMENNLSEEIKRQLHQYWAEELISEGFSEMERLRTPEDVKEIRIVSAFELSQTQRKLLSKKLKDVLGYEVTPKEETDQKLVAGIIIYIGNLVLDGSLKNKIEEQSKKM